MIDAPDPGMPAASRRLVLATVLCSCLGVGLTFGFQPPLIALVLRRAGASNFAVGSVTAASLIAVLLLGPLYPRLLARLGLRRAVVTGVTLCALVLLAMPLWPTVPVWLLLRVLTGSVLGLGWIASEVWLNNVAGPHARGTVMGLYGTVFSSGVMLGPALLQITGTRGWPPFAIGAAALLCTLLPLLTRRQVQSVAPVFTTLRNLKLAVRGAPVIMLAALVAGLVESAELTLLPLFGIQAGFHDRAALGLVTVFMAGNVVLQVPIGVLADRYGRGTLLSVCAALSSVGPWLLEPWLAAPALLWPLLFTWGGTSYAFYSQGIALLGGAVAESDLPTANTVFVMVYCFGGVVGPSVGGMAMDAWPRLGLPVVLCGAACVLLAALLLRPPQRG